MSAEPDIAALAVLITEPARTAILTHLLDGRSWTAAELARIAGVRPSTASVHLRRLVEGKLLKMSPAGRHRYFRIADGEIARLLEQLARLAPRGKIETPGSRRAALRLRHCRLCYDHLAGRIGVAIAESMIQKGWLIEEEPWFRVTEAGQQALAELGVESVPGRTCMDWSERRLHIAGELGKQLAHVLLARKWLRRDPKSRALWVTPHGADSLNRYLGLNMVTADLSRNHRPPPLA
jgi:DNA-binding transcriptional ArsR family regulator